mgnify:CR=1 FL=1
MFRLILFCTCLQTFSVFALQANKINLGLIVIPGVLEYKKPEAPYSQLFIQLSKALTVPFDVHYMPSARANKLLNSKKLDCIFPIIPSTRRAVATLLSQPVNGIRAYIFTNHRNVYSKINQLAGKRVVYLRGYVFGDLIERETKINFFPVTNQQAALNILFKQRADAYLEYIPDIKFALSASDFKKLYFDEPNPVIASNDYFECLDHPDSSKFINNLNEIMSQYRKDGKMKTILNNYFVPTSVN